jgi:Concanavalin A-like lectin/glucanases superfamily
MDITMHSVRVTSALALLLLLTLLSGPVLAQSRLDRSAPTAQGLLGWWRAVAGLTGGRTWYDLTGRFPATLTNVDAAGSSGWGASTRPGGQGEVRFDGTNDYGALAVTSQLWPPAVSVLLWVKRTATGADYQGVFTGGDNGGFRDITVRASGGMNVSFVTSTSAFLQQDNVNPGSVAVGVWTHITYTYSSTAGLQGYVNCVPNGAPNSPNGTMYPLTTLGTVVGASSPTVGFFAGAIDDIKLYNRVLSTQEVCQVMRDSQRGEPKLLPPVLLVGVLPPLVVGGPKSGFFPFFQAP